MLTMAKKPVAPTYPVNAALEAAVIAHAEDDTPRLVYADWLDENGDSDRAAFIRTQVALSGKNPADDDYVDLTERHIESWAKVRARFRKPKLPVEVGFTDAGVAWGEEEAHGFRRGFPYSVHEPEFEDRGPNLDDARRFREVLPELFRTSTVRGLELRNDFRRHLPLILSAPSAAEVSALFTKEYDWERDGSPTMIQSIAASPAVPQLRWLTIDSIWERPDVKGLGEIPFQNLRRFGVSFQDGPAAPIKKVFGSDGFRQLGQLFLQVRNSAIAAIPVLAKLPNLHSLTLWEVTKEVLAAIAGATKYPTVSRLCFHTYTTFKDGLRELAKVKFPNLKVLEIHQGSGDPEDRLTGKDITILANSSLFDRLTVFAAPKNAIGDRGFRAIAETPSAKTLRVLRMGNNPLGMKSLALIGETVAFPRLTTLDLRPADTALGTAEITRFLQSFAATGIRHLNLSYLPVGDAGAKAIAANPVFATLRVLDLCHCQIGKAGLRALIDSPNLRGLVCLYLSSNPCEKSADSFLDSSVFPELGECGILPARSPMLRTLDTARPSVHWLEIGSLTPPVTPL